MMASMQQFIMVLAPLLPLLVAAGFVIRAWRNGLAALYPLAALPAVAGALWFDGGATVHLEWLLLGTTLGITDHTRVFLFFTALLWLLAGLFAIGFLKQDAGRHRFAVFYLLTMAGNLGLVVARDMIGFYLFFALMSFASYGLVAHYRDDATRRAARIYIYFVVASEFALFAALALLAANSGTFDIAAAAAFATDDRIMLLLFIGFGIKAGAILLHLWLPLAYRAAPFPASAVLAGPMVKAGLLGWLAFLPLGHASLPGWGTAWIILGVTGAFFGVLVGVTQRDPKSVLGYSSISQMGWLMILTGIVLIEPDGYAAVTAAMLIYALHHALVKSALFLGTGVVARTTGRPRRLAIAGLAVTALIMAGAPLTSGAVAKLAFKSAAGLLDHTPLFWVHVAIPAAALGTALLMGRFIYTVTRMSRDSEAAAAGPGLWLPWLVLPGILLVALWLWPPAQTWAMQSLSPGKLWSAAWPAALGIIVALGVWRTDHAGLWRWSPELPAGDLVVRFEKISAQLVRGTGQSGPIFAHMIAGLRIAGGRLIGCVRWTQWLARGEQAITRWSMVGICYLALILLLMLIMSNGPF